MKNITIARSCEKHLLPGVLPHSFFYKRKLDFHAWLLIFPSFVFLVLFTLYPICSTFIDSLYAENLASKIPHFIGTGNYQHLLQDQVFRQAVKNNLIIALVTVPVSIAIGLSMALFANSKIKGTSIIRAGYFYPTLLPLIAVANIWMFIYTPDYGLLSYVEHLFGLKSTNWLGDPATVLPAVIAVLIWKESGYFMIFFLSGLQNISRDMYEAARMDGAGDWQIFRKITWPLLMPTTLFVAIIALTNAFKTVDHLYIMTKGGPDNASTMILYYLYQVGFEFWDIGLASAITTVLVVLLLVITCIKFFTIDKRTHYS
ncbi:sugar ABC transporter permease [Sporomusa sp.]|uniref:carbohydrate ABC transporter permease n=1 Tax=Sporomusa sp. TaxID=2078658 RepID=UPI002CAF21D0|nr:sugar ABC transporter permease [Sporomusa sp.]HWR06762.1 sugar ABC transporter permease [Sporomusa sp.]